MVDDRRKGIILVVEDNVPILRVLVRILVDEGYYLVETAASKAEAILKLTIAPVDLVLTDLGLPDGDGLEVYDWIKTNPHREHIPVIFLTANFNDIRFKARNLESAVLRKPIAMDELLNRVAAVLSQ